MQPTLTFQRHTGPPSRPQNCAFKNHSLTSLLLHCEPPSPGPTGGGSAGPTGGSSQSPHWHLLLFEAQSGQPVSNQSLRDELYVQFQQLRPATLYTLLLYAINEQGKSAPLRLQAATLGPPEKRQMSQGEFCSPI